MRTLILVVPFLYFVDAYEPYRGPPEIVLQNGSEVWFRTSQLSNYQNKFSLHCHATGEPEKYEWYKDGKPLSVDGNRIVWVKPSQSGTIVFLDPRDDDQGYYQCFVKNALGTAVSNKMQLRLGVLEPFVSLGKRQVTGFEGDSLTMKCDVPFGIPPPTLFWTSRNPKQSSSFRSLSSSKHITVDGNGDLQFSYVTKEDGDPDFVYQCGASSPVLHDGVRLGDEVQLIVKPPQTIKMRPAHILYVSPKKTESKAGSKLVLICIFGGRPLPVVEWSKLDGNIPTDRIRDLTSVDSAYGKMLVIDNVRNSDAGTYQCSAQGVSHQMEVSITAAPFWESGKQPKDAEEPEGGTAHLHCQAFGDPKPEIQWSRNGKQVKSGDRFTIVDGGQTLRIANLSHHDDIGVYQCNASNIHGYTYANIFLKINAYAPSFKMPSRVTLKVVRNTTVFMPCDVVAAPKADVHWVNDKDSSVKDIANVSKRITIFENQTLKLSTTERGDEGVYYCNVSNKYGIDRALYNLSVYSPTRFIKVPKYEKKNVEANSSLILDCEAIADPRLELEYTWKRNGYPINNTDHFQIRGTSLHLMKVRGWHSGLIECSVSSGVDQIKAEFNLTIIDVPAMPEVHNIDCDDERAVITWDKPNEYGDKIIDYTVEKHITFEQGRWETIGKVINRENNPDSTYTLTYKLSPWVVYTFRVIARNTHGSSQPGYGFNTVCSTASTYPSMNPANVHAEGNEPNNLVITWQPMNKVDWNGPELQYLIRYRFDDDQSPWRQILIEDPLAKEAILRDQPTFRRYLVQVRAVNEIGQCTVEPDIVVGYSGEDVPLEPPSNFTILDKTNWTAIVFGWKHVEEDSVRGFFKGYLIEYWFTNKPMDIAKVMVPSEQNSTALTGLEPMKNYSARILTVNKRYHSVPSPTLHFMTPEGLPSKVHNMKIRAVGSTSFYVTWEPCREPNGFIRGYFLEFEDAETREIEETFVVSRQLYYLYEKAKVNTQYMVWVWAETHAGEGPKVFRVTRTMELKAPEAPRFTVTILTSYEAEVLWWPLKPLNGTTPVMPGSSFYVNYSVAGSNVWSRSNIIKLPETRVLLGNLTEGTVYELVGVSMEQNRMNRSVPTIIQTRSNGFFARIFRGHMHGTAWFISTMSVLLIATFTVLIMCCCQRKHSGKYPVKRKEIEKGCFHPDAEEHKNFMEYQYGFVN